MTDPDAVPGDPSPSRDPGAAGQVTRGPAEAWVGRYVTAWDSNDPADVRALFTPDGEYRFHPWDEPVVGHDAITAAWLDGSDDAGDHAFTWEVVAVDGPTAVVQGHTAYTAGEAAGRSYENLWVLVLASDGRAQRFTEWYMERSAAAGD